MRRRRGKWKKGFLWPKGFGIRRRRRTIEAALAGDRSSKIVLKALGLSFFKRGNKLCILNKKESALPSTPLLSKTVKTFLSKEPIPGRVYLGKGRYTVRRRQPRSAEFVHLKLSALFQKGGEHEKAKTEAARKNRRRTPRAS